MNSSGTIAVSETRRGRTTPDGRMDVVEAARYIGVAQSTLANWRVLGSGPPYVKMARIWYRQADIDAWLARKTATSTAQARLNAVPRLVPA